MSLDPELKSILKELMSEIKEIHKHNDTIYKEIEKIKHHQSSAFEKVAEFGANAITISMLKESLDLLKSNNNKTNLIGKMLQEIAKMKEDEK